MKIELLVQLVNLIFCVKFYIIIGLKFTKFIKINFKYLGALSLKEVPKKLVVIGGGVIGLELGSVYQRLGAQVDVIEYAGKILPPFDNEVSSEFLKILKKQKINFHLNTKVVGGTVNGNIISIITEDVKVIL